MRRIPLVLACALALGLGAPAGALDGVGESTVATVLTTSDVLADVASEGAWPWGSFEEFMLGGSVYAAPGGEVAVAGEDVYVLVNAWTPPYEFTGLVHYDGADFVHLVQTGEPWSGGLTKKMLLRSVTAPPAGIAAGPLASGHPVLLVLRGLLGDGADAFAADLVLVDPTDPPDLTVDDDGEPLGYAPLHTFVGTQDASGNWSILDETAVAIAGDGTVYVGPWRDGTITRLAYANGAYAASTLSTSFAAGGGLAIDGAGHLYAWEQGMAWRPSDPDGGEYREIFPFHTEPGSRSNFSAYVARGTRVATRRSLIGSLAP